MLVLHRKCIKNMFFCQFQNDCLDSYKSRLLTKCNAPDTFNKEYNYDTIGSLAFPMDDQKAFTKCCQYFNVDGRSENGGTTTMYPGENHCLKIAD